MGPVVLFVAMLPARLGEQIRLAKDLAAAGGPRSLFICSPSLPARAARSIGEAGLDRIDFRTGDLIVGAAADGNVRSSAGPARGGSGHGGGVGRRLVDALRKRLKSDARITGYVRLAKMVLLHNSILQVFRSARMLRRLERQFAQALRILDHHAPAALLPLGDRHGDIEPALLKACRSRGVPVIIPYMTFSDFRGLALMRENNILVHNPAYSSLYVKWVFRRNRGQVYQGMLYYRPFELMALKRFGVLSANPWVMGAGHSDIVCVDSRATGDRYLGYGVPEAKLRIVGDTAFDGLHQAYLARDGLRRSLIREYALDPEKKNIIVSLPNLAEHDLLPWDAHFREIDFLMAALKGTGGNILVSLHPKMDPSKYAYLEGEFGCRILTQRLAQALPAGDLFVATFSSTVVWAVLCGIRAVVVDFYGLDSDMFDFLKSVSIVTRRDDLSATLEQALLTAPDFSEDWRKLSREEVFDGRTLQRYLRLIPSKDGMLT